MILSWLALIWKIQLFLNSFLWRNVLEFMIQLGNGSQVYDCDIIYRSLWTLMSFTAHFGSFSYSAGHF